MYAKIQIKGNIELITGMHIGGSSAFAAIGAVDSPIVKDAQTNLPMIPGSSLKGKMRTLLAKAYNSNPFVEADKDDDRIIRLFGTSKKASNGRIAPARIIISDMIMSNATELRAKGVQSLTEVKFENSISRLTSVANPRQIERAIRGSVFPVDIIYEADDEKAIETDFETLIQGMKLLQYDYIGGSGSRGYGKIKFKDLEAKVVIGDVNGSIIAKCNQMFSEMFNDK